MDKQPKKAVKITKLVLSIIFYVIIGLLFLFAIMTLTQKREDQIPNLFGLGFYVVHPEADSMEGSEKESFYRGDLVIVHVLNDKKREKLDLKDMHEKNIVISFFDRGIEFSDGTRGAINTHRIVEYGTLSGDKEYVRTKGDKPGLEMDSYLLERSDILAIYKGKIKGAGKVVGFMQTPLGFGLVVLAPMLILLIWQGYVLIRNVFEEKQKTLLAQQAETKVDTISEDERKQIEDEERKRIADEERERIRQELLKELEEEKNKEK